MSQDKKEVPVLIVGAGPCGVTIANLLGSYGIETLLIDRSPAILDFPRAVGLDDEALRTFQAAGLAEDMLRDMIQNVPMRMYTAAKQCFAEILPSTREFGWCRRNLFSQPLGEATLRKGLARYPHVEMALGVELLSLVQDEHGVDATLRQADGSMSTVRAQYLVASDGARSTVREGILKVPYEGETHSHKWVVIECEDDPLDAPYTALHCEPRRPYVCLRLPYGLRRWEFMLFPGEDGDQMLTPEKVQMLLSHHVEHPERLKVIRARVYTHNSRVAKDFVVGRVCLAGDTAHITPPWIGQGLNAGLRDAFNLAWKLAWIVRGRMKPELLASYHDERHAHAQAMIDLADLFGSVLSQRNRLVAWLRDRFFLSIKNIPKVRDYVLQMKFKPMPRFVKGVVLNSGHAARDDLVGRMFIQPVVEQISGEPRKLDDVIGGCFALVSWRCNPLAQMSPALAEQLRLLKCDQFVAVRARSSAWEVNRCTGEAPMVNLIQDTDNLLNAWFQARGVDWVLIRPDRFVAAAGLAASAPEQLTEFCRTVVR
ncbi:bifunctional 3-(3-hydroxy-phenyl)propionate/3-hydroxycinnamic acid hydroxylase [Curvibacter gracilis]|uniref:bifunctional 3-(3-hydroxy-phenyl)propionate/3-hydroxycinnamic acid hydroxylase n=1 Tax=Curvibacter gracilis TaxID=230310 RepID=UPI000485DD46|nr:bifunctional 3-(3-hydroxy-phenyl)propionate/3-hydroxycinnamic acid hydroxylase [Curvibacter gracilis]